MEVSHRPELSLTLNNQKDYDLILFTTLPNSKKFLERKDYKSIKRLTREIYYTYGPNYFDPNRDINEHVINGNDAHLVVISLFRYFEDIVSNSNYKYELELAGYAAIILDAVLDDSIERIKVE